VSYEVVLENDIRAVLNILSMNCKYVDDWDDILGHAMREKHYWILLSTSINLGFYTTIYCKMKKDTTSLFIARLYGKYKISCIRRNKCPVIYSNMGAFSVSSAEDQIP
jgi:hypothetical protein